MRHPVRPQTFDTERPDIPVAWQQGPVAPQHAAGERIGLAEGNRRAAGAAEAQGEPADAAEQVKDTHKLELGL